MGASAAVPRHRAHADQCGAWARLAQSARLCPPLYQRDAL